MCPIVEPDANPYPSLAPAQPRFPRLSSCRLRLGGPPPGLGNLRLVGAYCRDPHVRERLWGRSRETSGGRQAPRGRRRTKGEGPANGESLDGPFCFGRRGCQADNSLSDLPRTHRGSSGRSPSACRSLSCPAFPLRDLRKRFISPLGAPPQANRANYIDGI